MKQRPGVRQAFIAVLVLVVTLTGCGGSSDSTSSTETSLAGIPLCEAFESSLEKFSIFYDSTEFGALPARIEEFRARALIPSSTEKQFAEWFCEMSERFPGQMNPYFNDYVFGPSEVWDVVPLEYDWGGRILAAQLGVYLPGEAREFPADSMKPWGNPNTYVDDVFPGCEPGLGLRTRAKPKGIISQSPKRPAMAPLPVATKFWTTVAPGAISALKTGTFGEYQRASKEEWELTFASSLLHPPTRYDPPDGRYQVLYLMERFEARLIEAGNLLYIKVACPELWAQLNAGDEDDPESYLDYLSTALTQPALKRRFASLYSWPTHRGVEWSGAAERGIWVLTGCNFERLAFTSTLVTDDPEQQGYLGFECGLNPDAASGELKNSPRGFVGPSFVYVYNESFSRDVAVQRKKASDSNSEYNVAYCGDAYVDYLGEYMSADFTSDPHLFFVAYFKSADVLEEWESWFGDDPDVAGKIAEIHRRYNFRQC
jgi:hypothetical protein